jgi:hypothetical protein
LPFRNYDTCTFEPLCPLFAHASGLGLGPEGSLRVEPVQSVRGTLRVEPGDPGPQPGVTFFCFLFRHKCFWHAPAIGNAWRSLPMVCRSYNNARRAVDNARLAFHGCLYLFSSRTEWFSSGTENSHIFISHKYEFVLHKYSHIIISHKDTIKVTQLPYFTKEQLKSHNSPTWQRNN